jgi:hypothetical protein
MFRFPPQLLADSQGLLTSVVFLEYYQAARLAVRPQKVWEIHRYAQQNLIFPHSLCRRYMGTNDVPADHVLMALGSQRCTWQTLAS